MTRDEPEAAPLTAEAWDDLLNDNRLSLSYKKRAAAVAEHRPLIEAAIRSGSPTDAALPTTTRALQDGGHAALGEAMQAEHLPEWYCIGQEDWTAFGSRVELHLWQLGYGVVRAASGSPEPVLERLRAAIEAELALLPDEPTQFDMGAAAAYHWCLAALANR